ncbi:DUF4377 domain-containing protein [Chitinophaga sp. YIM B06452]|uniref:DUF4377 domain-containing protein n=1 Tax=Chitinophaga sp. YIM B06452 TaxID=3082158 RepID=UPI0031FEF22E
MKQHHILVLSAALAFTACQNNPKTNATDSTAITQTSPAEGYYEASLAAASSPGRHITLNLRPANDAEMTTDYLNATPEVVQIGNWALQDSGIVVTLVTVGSGNPEKDTLTFRQEGESLRYTGSDYGTDGLTLVKKEKPAPGNKELIVWVKAEEECDRGPGFGKMKCYQVQYGDKMMVPANETWDKLLEPIEGFTFEKENIYKLKINRIPRDPKIQDIGAYEYKLIEVMLKEKAK